MSVKNQCPVCRSEINSNNILFVNENENDNGNRKKEKRLNKFDQLEILLNSFHENDKVLIFSQFDNTFVRIEHICNSLKKKFSYIKGTAPTIQNIVDHYYHKDLNILLLNAKNYATGMNLENTNHIILFHKMNSDIEVQIIGRANRLNRKRN